MPLAVAAVPAPALRPPARFCGPPGRPLAALSLGPTASLFLPLVGARLTWAARMEKDCGSPALRAAGLEENGARKEVARELGVPDGANIRDRLLASSGVSDPHVYATALDYGVKLLLNAYRAKAIAPADVPQSLPPPSTPPLAQLTGLEEGNRQAVVEMANVPRPVRVFYDQRLSRPEMMGVDALALSENPAEAVVTLKMYDIRPGEPILLPNTVSDPQRWRVPDVRSPLLLVPADLPAQLTVERVAALSAIASGLEEGMLRITPESWAARVEGKDVFSIMY